MTEMLPSYIANDAAPLFADCSRMTTDELVEYEPPPERLAFYALHTEEGLKAFLYDVYWIGYPGLFVAANHVWSLLIAPRAYRCTLMGQLSGAGGAGKQALVNTLNQFITEALGPFTSYPEVSDFESLDAWNAHCQAMNADDNEHVLRTVDKYAVILDGSAPKGQQTADGVVVRGPWNLRDRLPQHAPE